MTKKYFLPFILLVFLSSSAQKIRFECDVAGNQIIREFCVNCISKVASTAKNDNEIVNNNMKKFSSEDSFS